MKRFIALVLSLVMALSLTTVAWGATASVGSASELATAVSSGGEILLTADITIDAPLSIVADTVIDGDGHTLTYTGTDRAITVNGGGYDLTVTDLDIAFPAASYRERGINYSTNGTLTLTNVTIGSESAYPTYAINLAGASDDATVNISGCAIYGCIALNAWGEDLVVTATNTDFTSVDNSNVENYSAVNLNNNGTKSAENSVITITGGSITAKDENGAPSSATSNGTLTGVIDISGCPSVVGSSKVVVAIITYPGSTNFYSYFSVADATEAALSRGETKIELLETIVNSGETFVPDSSITYVPPAGAELVDDGTGNVVVAPTGTSGGAVATKFYVADDAAADDWKLLASFPGDDLSDFAKDSSDNFLPCYEVPNYGFFTEVKAANGAYKLTYGAAKVVYLAPVDYSDVHYDYKATALKVVDEDDAECGDWFVTSLDEDDKYYAAYTKKGEVEGVFVAEKNGSMQILVGGKIVDVEWQDIGTDVEWKLHQFKGYDVVNGEYTTVKCENCPKVAKLYANATAATVGKKDAVKIDTLGWITFADYMDFGANAPVVTDKVTSAETFDAGIAMYVGMSVMAAAGSAVVLKKRED